MSVATRRMSAFSAVPGAKNVIAVKSDSGMMGGSVSHEFMLLSEIGEDTLAICPECGYKANMEAAECIVKNEQAEDAPLTKIHTPDAKTIDDLAKFLDAGRKTPLQGGRLSEKCGRFLRHRLYPR